MADPSRPPFDAVGDLYLAGAPIMGTYQGVRAGHGMNNALLRALFADLDAWEMVETSADGIETVVQDWKQLEAAPIAAIA